MAELLTSGLDEQTVSGLLMGNPGCKAITGFDDITYGVMVEAGVLVVAPADQEPAELGLSYDQLVVARYAIENSGEPFRGGEVADNSGVLLPRERFNQAVFDKASGLLPFFTDIAGHNGLWYRERNVHQLGYESAGTAEISDGESSDIVLDPFDRAIGDLSLDQQAVITAARDTIPLEGMSEDDLAQQINDMFPDMMPRQIKSLLHSSIHRLQNTMEVPPFVLGEKGKGAQRKKHVGIDRSFVPGLDIEDPAIGEQITKREAPSLHRIQRGRKAIGNNVVGATAVLSPAEQKRRKEGAPISWQIDLKRLVVDGLEVEVHQDVLELVSSVRTAAPKNPTRLWHVAKVFDGEFMEESKFRRFVVWANLAIDALNKVAPVIIVDNHGRATRRDTKTRYSFNEKGDWASVNDVESGTSLLPYSVK